MNTYGAVAEILSSELFRRLLNADCIKVAELNAAIAVLIECRIDFELVFLGGSTGERPEAALEIALTPTVSFSLTFTFDCF